jgi:hypothetical protein
VFAMEIATLANLLRETEERHGSYEKAHAKHRWSDWYAAYLNAWLANTGADEAARAAASY